jgi:hypothetical protein
MMSAWSTLDKGLCYLQESALLVMQINAAAENDEDAQQECMLVPSNAFINSYYYAQPAFQKFFMMEPVDQGGYRPSEGIN